MAPSNHKRIASLDGLRAISVLLVFLAHGGVAVGAPHWLRETYSYANVGVRVFFVISGFLITHLLLREQERHGAIDLPAFYVRRAYRILPAAYAYMAIITVACWAHLGKVDLATSYLYLANYHEHHAWELGHLWSLGVEEQFYLLWPFVLVLIFPHRRAVLLATILAAPVVRAALLLAYARRVPGVSMQSVTFWFPSVADALATGCLLAVIRPALDRHARRLEHRAMLLVPLATLLLVQVQRIPWRYTGLGYQLLVVPLIHAGIALTIDHCVRRRYALLDARPVAWCGTISYSLYLWQQPFLFSADKLGRVAGWWQRYPLNLLLSFGCGVASFYLVERPVMRYRERAARGAAPRRQPVPAPAPVLTLLGE